jgi:hypothetical protein
MTYVSGGLIQASDYNGFVSTTVSGNINAVWNSSYGQPALSTVNVGNTVSAAQWSTLNSTITTMSSHQGTAITSRTNPVTGNIITILSNVGTDITNCNNNRYNAATQGTQFVGWTGNASLTGGAGSGLSPWTATFTDTITFASTTAASNFFNAGGLMKIQFHKTSTGTVADTPWNDLVNNICGTIYLTSTGASKTLNGQAYTGITKIGGSGTPSILATGTGFAQLTASPVIVYKQFDVGGTYSSNYVQVTAAVSGAILTLVTTWFDAGGVSGTAQITGGTATTGITFGTAGTTVVTYFPPETTYLTNTWGSPTVTSSLSVIL